MDNYRVYKHTAPNGKMYVGITSMKPEKRWRNGKGYQANEYFSNAIDKYGWDNFKHEVLVDGLSKEQAELVEQQLICYWDLTNRENGYNINHGGHIIGTHSKETREKMSKAKKGKYLGENNPNYGKHLSENQKRKLSDARKGKYGGKNHPMYGKKHTEESKKKMSISHRNLSEATRQKMSEAAKLHVGALNHFYGKHHSDEAKQKMSKAKDNVKRRVVAIDKDTNEFLFICDSLKEAERRVGRAYQNIAACCKGKKKTAGGYKWEYYDEYIKERREIC